MELALSALEVLIHSESDLPLLLKIGLIQLSPLASSVLAGLITIIEETIFSAVNRSVYFNKLHNKRERN